MKLLYLPLETSRLFNQDGCKTAWRNVLGEKNVTVFSYILEACRHGKDVMVAHFNKLVLDLDIDVVFMQLQETNYFNPELFSKLKDLKPNVKFINWCGDYRPYIMEKFLEIGKVIDLSLLSNQGQLDVYRQAGIKRIEYSQVGMDVSVFKPLNIRKNQRIIFAGNRSYLFADSDKRDMLLRQLAKEFDGIFEIYGTGWSGLPVKQPLYHDKFNLLLNQSQMSIGINAINTVPFYFSERQVQHMASGTLHICHYVPGLETYFRNKYHCLWYNTVDECIDLCKTYIRYPDVCNEIGGYGAKAIQDGHTWEQRYQEILEML